MFSTGFMYLLVMLDSIGTSLSWLTGLTGIIICIYIIIIACNSEFQRSSPEDVVSKLSKILRMPILIFLLLLGTNTFLPSSKEAAAIYIIPKIVNNEKFQGMANNGLQVLEALSEQWSNDILDKHLRMKSTNSTK